MVAKIRLLGGWERDGPIFSYHDTIFCGPLRDRINRVLFVGSKQLGHRVLRELYGLAPEALVGIITIDDQKDSRSAFPDFEMFSRESGLQLHVAKDRRHSEEIIKSLKPELCFVVGWYWLIGDDVLNSVPHGFVGIHNSLLPKYRGGSPLVWQILRNEKEVGFSLFSFDSGMDTGPIWAQGRVPLGREDYVSDVLAKLEEETIRMVRAGYHGLLEGSVMPSPQNNAEATYCAQRLPSDGRIDWHAPAEDVHNFIRAQSDPYPGAFTHYEGRILKIWRARVFDRRYFGTPGQVARIEEDGVYVICGDNRAIILEETELSDGKRGRATEAIRTIKWRMSE
jgi:methionyl-tRNA formyltransferase